MTRTIFYGRATEQFGELSLPGAGEALPVVVNIHGGFWKVEYDLAHARPFCRALTAAGYATWNIEYRRVGQPGGGWPGTLDDVRAAAELLGPLAARYSLDLSQMVLVGHSAGGQLALWLAAEGVIPFRGVVALAAVSDLRWAAGHRLSDGGDAVQRFLGGEPEEVAVRYDMASPFERLPLRVPQQLLHGRLDRDVPLALSERYVARAQALGDDATLTVLPNTGHMPLIDPESEAWPVVCDTVSALY